MEDGNGGFMSNILFLGGKYGWVDGDNTSFEDWQADMEF